MTDSIHQQPDSSLRRVVRNSSWLLAAQVVASAMMFVQIIMSTRALGVASYGAFVLVTTFVLSVIQICDCRVWEALITFVPRFRVQGDQVKAVATVQMCLMVEMLSGVVAMLVVVGLADFAGAILFRDQAAAGSIRLFAVLALANIPHEPITAMLRVVDRFHLQASYRLALSITRMIATAVACLVSPSVQSLLIAELIAHFVGSAALLFMGSYVANSMGWSLWRLSALKSLRADFHAIVRFMFYSSVAGNTRMVTTKADTLLLGLLATPAVVGVYDLAKKVAEGVLSLATPLYMAIFPEMSAQVAASRFDEARMLQREISRLVIIGVLPLCAAGTLLVPFLIPPVFGTAYGAAAPLLQILLWQLLSLHLVWFPGYLLALGKARTQTLLVCMDAATYLALLFVLIPALGGVGAAIATTGRVLIWMLMAHFALIKLVPTRLDGQSPPHHSPLAQPQELAP